MSFTDYDLSVLEWIQQNRVRSLDQFFKFITDSAPFIAIAIALFYLIYGFVKKTPFLQYRKYEVVIAFALNALIIGIIKYAVNRTRPFVIDANIEKLTWGGSPSFPSGHTGDAVIIAIMVSLVFYKQKWWLTLLWIWAILVGYSRMILGVHFPSDVLGAAIVSFIVAKIVQVYFKKRKFA